MAEKKKAEERQTKTKEPAEGDGEPEVPAKRRESRKVYRFDDWASI